MFNNNLNYRQRRSVYSRKNNNIFCGIKNVFGSIAFLQCGCMSLILTTNVFLGGWSVNYILDIFINKMIPFWGAALIGLLVGEVSVPVALVMLVLKYFKVF